MTEMSTLRNGIPAKNLCTFGFGFLFCFVLAQLRLSSPQTATFRVEGTITSAWDSFPKDYLVPRRMITFEGTHIEENGAGDKEENVSIPRTEVTFSGERTNKTVTVDEHGRFHAELPVGIYRMVARGPQVGGLLLTKYARMFQANSPATITLSGTLYFDRANCDSVISGETESQRLEAWKNVCGGEDTYSSPTKDGAPLEIYFRYSKREPTTDGYIYKGESGTSRSQPPVFVAYNLFCLEAEKVTYVSKAQMIKASGNVVTVDGTGKTHTADSVSVTLRDGVALPF